jgi:16S rRNA (adenine1518-N6/adenine1519-N6)-dimethyltransferase
MKKKIFNHTARHPVMQHSKRWGQYELVDNNAITNIIDTLELKPEDTVIEIGPGTGVLTLPIKEKVSRIIAVEIDRMLCVLLADKGVEVVNIDFLRMDLSSLPEGVKIVSNLPYYITTPIITKILEEKVLFERLVFTMQDEVARRIVADAGDKDYGEISVLVHFYTEPSIVAEIPRGCFKPVPKVDSCTVCFKRKQPDQLSFPEEFLFKVVHAGFSCRRKMLKNVLQHFGPLENVTIDLSRRAETLSVKEFIQLAQELWLIQKA